MANCAGCIGQVEPRDPVGAVIVHCAAAAALEDPRFPPVSPIELASLDIEVSLLTPAEEVIDLDRIEVGRHGLIVSHGGCRGLLLPQVATEHGWSREQFLVQTCRKAGLAERRVAARREDLLFRGRGVRRSASVWRRAFRLRSEASADRRSLGGGWSGPPSRSRWPSPALHLSSLTQPLGEELAAGRQHDGCDERRAHLGIAPELKWPAYEADVDEPHLVRAIGQRRSIAAPACARTSGTPARFSSARPPRSTDPTRSPPTDDRCPSSPLTTVCRSS